MLTQPLKAFKLILVCLPIGIRTAASIETTNGTVLGFVDQTNGQVQSSKLNVLARWNGQTCSIETVLVEIRRCIC